MTASVGSVAATSARPPGPSGGGVAYRSDIDGLRALAVTLVVAYHAGLPVVSGGFVGVDVFFVISGFLITGLLLDELQRTGSVSLRHFYARRARRLLPLSFLVLGVTTLASWLLLPPLDHEPVGRDGLSAALYVANWQFAASSVDYFADDVAGSPFLHYWSLSVEEQFYLVWPLLLLALAVPGRRRGRQGWAGTRTRVLLGLLVLSGVSFWLSLTQASDGPWSYYGLHTRAWELGVGAALAFCRPLLPSLPRLWAGSLAWVGSALIVWSALTVTSSTPFPGSAAVWPVLGAAAVVAGGARLPCRGPSQLLASPPARYVGRLSYAWYLWHWPVLVLARAQDGSFWSGPAGTVTAVALSFLLAAASTRWVERPLRTSAWLSGSVRRSLAFGAVATAASAAAASLLLLPTALAPAPVALPALETPYRAAGPELSQPGEEPRLVMSPKQARDDAVQTLGACHAPFARPEPAGACVFGDPDGDVSVALIGDSHAQHWFPAFEALAQEKGWQLHAWTKSACSYTDVRLWADTFDREYVECAQWREAVDARLAALPVLDTVVLVRSQAHQGRVLDSEGEIAGSEQVSALWREGTSRSLARLREESRSVVLFADSPWAPEDVPRCLSEHDSAEDCAFPRDGHTGLDDALVSAEVAAVQEHPEAAVLHVTDLLCPDQRCPVVTRDGVVIYRDNHHLTATFSRLLAPSLARLLDAHAVPAS